MTAFKDHFSALAPAYRRFRPGYPGALFDFLADLAPGRDAAWDCGCGSGQAALELAARFERVWATDASARQLAEAVPHPRVDYRVAPAEASTLPDRAVDLVTVAQALHWFDTAAFYREVRRVSRPGGVLAAFGYGLLAIAPEIDPLLRTFYGDTVGPWWPPERRHLDNGYRDLPFPFATVAAPAFELREDWDLERLLGYLGTWSAVAAYRREQGRDPLPELAAALAAVWGPPARLRPVRWPLFLKVGRVA